jgi:hypothetical protein
VSPTEDKRALVSWWSFLAQLFSAQYEATQEQHRSMRTNRYRSIERAWLGADVIRCAATRQRWRIGAPSRAD